MARRTLNQNSALHRYFDLLASTLNAQNLTVDVILRADTQWNKERVKELLWKNLQKSITGKESTTKLTTKELTEVYDTLNKALGEKLHIHVDFPSYEEKLDKNRVN